MKNSAIGSSWKDVRSELFTKEEILESDMRVAIMSELIEARHEKGISQKKLEELSGVSQPVIARMETGKTSPQLDTVLKVLASLGKILAVVPLEQEKIDRDEIILFAKIIHRVILPPVCIFSGKYQNYKRKPTYSLF
ncbi:hypothetical protein HMPREF9188_00596 [Streptococcus sp. F0441]|nr:hypothetical protein HMPREF9188_00596 [Streptococcus sp. F0441]